jgi:hypothetical protein
MAEAELRIKLITGEEIAAHFERPATAWLVRRQMLEQVQHGEFVQCVKGEIPSRNVEAIDFICHFESDI